LFFLRLHEILSQLTSIGSTLDLEFMLRIALIAVSKEWETFIQSILGSATLLGWEEMWTALHHEEIKRLTKAGRSGKGS